MNLLIVVMSISLSHLVRGKRRLKSFGTSHLTYLLINSLLVRCLQRKQLNSFWKLRRAFFKSKKSFLIFFSVSLTKVSGKLYCFTLIIVLTSIILSYS